MLVRRCLLELRAKPAEIVLALLGGRPGCLERLLDLGSRLDHLDELGAKLVDPPVLLGQRRVGGGSGFARALELAVHGCELVGRDLLLPRAAKPGNEATCLVVAAGEVLVQLLDVPVALGEGSLDLGPRVDDSLEFGVEVFESALLRLDGRLGGAECSSGLLHLVAARFELAREARALAIPLRERGLRGGQTVGEAPALRAEALDLLVAAAHLGHEPLRVLVQLGLLVLIVVGRGRATPRAVGEAHRLVAPPVTLGGCNPKLLILVGQQSLRGRELRPLLLELCEKARLGRAGLGLVGLELLVEICVVVRRERLDESGAGAAALALVPALNLPAESRAEAGLGLQLDAVLRGERARQLRPRDEAALDDRLTEPLAAALLLLEGGLELLAREEPLLDEDATERSPRDAGRFHIRSIGAKGR